MQIRDRGNQEQLCRGDRRPAVEKPCLPRSEPKIAVAKARWPGWGVRISGGRILEGTKGGLHRPHFAPRGRNRLGPAAPTCSTAQNPRVTPSGNEAQPGLLARCAPPAPAPTLRSSGSAARISLRRAAGDRAAPTGSADSSGGAASGDNIPARTAPWVHRREGSERNGKAEAPRRLDSASQVSVRRLCGLHLGKLRRCRLPGGGRGARSPGPGPPCAPPGILWALEPVTPRPDTAEPWRSTSTEGRRSRRVLPQTLPRRAGRASAEPAPRQAHTRASPQSPPVLGGGSAAARARTRGRASFASFPALQRWGSDEGSRRPQGIREDSGRPRGRGSAPQRERRALDCQSARVGGADLGASSLQPAAAWLWEVRAGRGARVSWGCGAVCSRCLHKCESHIAGGRPPSLLGPYSFGTRTPGPLSENRGPEVRLSPAEGQWLLLSGVLFPRRRAVIPRAGGAGTARAATLVRTLLVDGHRLSLPAVPWLGAEATKTRTPPPSVSRRCRPSHLPVPFSDSSLGLAPSPLSGKTEATTPFRRPGEDCEDAARILGSLEIPSPWFPETWRYRFVCLYVCVLGRRGWRG